MQIGHNLPGFYPSVKSYHRQDRELSDQTPPIVKLTVGTLVLLQVADQRIDTLTAIKA